jgi:hypothetical protein
LYDCNGEKINELSHTDNLKTSKVIRFEVKGSQIWRLGKCGPLMLGELVLYNERGDLIDRYNQTTIINKDPDQFQPPPAYFNGTIKMSSSLGKVNKISFGVGVTVITPGDYEISARLEDDDGVEIDRDSKTMKLGKGNNTVVLEFNPTKFIMMQKNSRLHLLDLTITQKGQELDRIDRAWHSEPMGPNLLSEEISSNG